MRHRVSAHQIRSTESIRCRRARSDLRIRKALCCRGSVVEKTIENPLNPNPSASSTMLNPLSRRSGVGCGSVAGRTWQQAIQVAHEEVGIFSSSGMECAAHAEEVATCVGPARLIRQACSNGPIWPTAIQLSRPMIARRMPRRCCCCRRIR
jgi:hypothetical protein